MTIFQISITSDILCPWCFIGYRRLDKAIQLFRKTYPGGSRDTFDITWKAYLLRADAAPNVSIPMQELTASRMGASRAAQNEKHLIALAAAEGLTFDFMNGRVGSSMRGHRLLHYTLAKGSGGGSDRDSSDGSDAAAKKQTAVAEALFSAMFEQGKDIGDVQVLVEAAKAAGVEGLEEVRMYLESGEGEEEVRRENVEVREMGVNSVPNFRFSVGDREEVLDGAKDVGEFFEMLISMKEKTAIEQ